MQLIPATIYLQILCEEKQALLVMDTTVGFLFLLNGNRIGTVREEHLQQMSSSFKGHL
jgi:hypothetical protein